MERNKQETLEFDIPSDSGIVDGTELQVLVDFYVAMSSGAQEIQSSRQICRLLLLRRLVLYLEDNLMVLIYSSIYCA